MQQNTEAFSNKRANLTFTQAACCMMLHAFLAAKPVACPSKMPQASVLSLISLQKIHVFKGWVNDQNGNNVRYTGVSKNSGTPKSSILIGFSIINHSFLGTTIFGNIHTNDKKASYITNIIIFGKFCPFWVRVPAHLLW